MIIDFSTHLISRSFEAKMKRIMPERFDVPLENGDPEFRLKLMEKYRIDVQALIPVGQTQFVLAGYGPEEIAEICRSCNSDNYALCKAYPKRFVNICTISLLNIDFAMKELKRSIDELDCRAVMVATNQKGKGLDSSEYYPLYEKLVEHDLPLFLHPTHWGTYPLVSMDKGWRMMHVFGWPFDTTQAVWRLIFGGVLDRFPSLKIVTHHLGGMFPYFARRVELNFRMYFSQKMPKPLSEYLKNLYGDTALDGTASAFPCGLAFFGPDRMIFGTDYPMGPEKGEDFVRENLAGIKSLKIPDEQMTKILSGNARRLLKIS